MSAIRGLYHPVREENGDLLTGGCEAHNGPFVRRAGEIRSEGRAERTRGYSEKVLKGLIPPSPHPLTSPLSKESQIYDGEVSAETSVSHSRRADLPLFPASDFLSLSRSFGFANDFFFTLPKYSGLYVASYQ